MLKQLVSLQDLQPKNINESFLCDVLCFFAGLQSGHVDNYCYSEPEYLGDAVCGGHLWERFVNKHEAYYPFRDDPMLMHENLDRIVDVCKGVRNLIDLGPGSVEAFKQKTLPLLRALSPVQYMAVDMNEEFACNVMRFLKTAEPFVRASYRLQNFFEHMPSLDRNSLIYMPGITITNIKADLRFESIFKNLTRTLAHFGNALRDGGHFVFTYDSNQDESSIHRSYAHPAMAAHNTNFIQLVCRDLPTKGLFEDDFQHVTEWLEEHHLLKQLLVVKRDIAFEVAGHQFALAAGTKLHVTNCFKFTDDMIRATAQAAGFAQAEICTLKNSPVRMAILGKK